MMDKFFRFTPYDEDGEAACETIIAIDKIITVDIDFIDDIDAKSLVAFKMIDDMAFSCYMDALALKALTDILLRS